jgi:hypothetical protein
LQIERLALTNPADNVDWALKPTRNYVPSDRLSIFVTNSAGIFAFGSATNSGMLHAGTISCSTILHLLCAEQF